MIIESVTPTDFPPLIVKTAMRIIGLCVDENTLVLYGDKEVKIYNILIEKTIAQEKGGFELDKIKAIGVKNECLYIGREKTLEIYNFSVKDIFIWHRA